MFYRQKQTDSEHISSITEILHWIKNGPILQPPTATGLGPIYDLPIPVSPQATAMPPHNNPAAIITQQFETPQQDMSHDTEIPTGHTTSPVPDENAILAQIANEESIPIADTMISNNSSIEATRTSTRTKTKRDFLQPKFHEKVYNVRKKPTHTSVKKGLLQKIKRNQSILTSMGIGTEDPCLNQPYHLPSDKDP